MDDIFIYNNDEDKIPEILQQLFQVVNPAQRAGLRLFLDKSVHATRSSNPRA